MTFLQHKVFRETSYQRNIISKILEVGGEISTTGSKHDRIEARWENPKLDENLNFSIMDVFDEAIGSGNINRQRQSSEIFGINRGSEINRKYRNQDNGQRSSRWHVAWVQNVVETV